jgi:hypothetical protein
MYAVAALLALAGTILCYCIGAFYSVSFNIAIWSAETRGFMATLASCIWTASVPVAIALKEIK